MISIDQLRVLQKKISLLIQKYRATQGENQLLKKKLNNYEQRVSELESHYATIQEDQGEMESAILSTLQELEKIEDQFNREANQNNTDDSTDPSNAGLEL